MGQQRGQDGGLAATGRGVDEHDAGAGDDLVQGAGRDRAAHQGTVGVRLVADLLRGGDRELGLGPLGVEAEAVEDGGGSGVHAGQVWRRGMFVHMEDAEGSTAVLTETRRTSRLRRVFEPVAIAALTAAPASLVRSNLPALVAVIALGVLLLVVTQHRLARAGGATVTIDQGRMTVASEYGRLQLDVELDTVREARFVDDEHYMTGTRNITLVLLQADGTEHYANMNAWAYSREARWPVVFLAEVDRLGIHMEGGQRKLLLQTFSRRVLP